MSIVNRNLNWKEPYPPLPLISIQIQPFQTKITIINDCFEFFVGNIQVYYFIFQTFFLNHQENETIAQIRFTQKEIAC